MIVPIVVPRANRHSVVKMISKTDDRVVDNDGVRLRVKGARGSNEIAIETVQVLDVVTVHECARFTIQLVREVLVFRIEGLEDLVGVFPPRRCEENQLAEFGAVVEELSQIGTLSSPHHHGLAVDCNLGGESRKHGKRETGGDMDSGVALRSARSSHPGPESVRHTYNTTPRE